MTSALSSTETGLLIQQGLASRHRTERRFRLLGLGAVLLALSFLGVLLVSVIQLGVGAFSQTAIRLDVTFDKDLVADGNYDKMWKDALRARFPDVTSRSDRRELTRLVSTGAIDTLRKAIADNPEWIGQTHPVWLLADDEVDRAVKENISKAVPAGDRRISDAQLDFLDALHAQDRVDSRFNWTFFTHGDSREPEQAGILGSIVGSLLTLLICFLLSFPTGVLASIYLEEFAPRNRWTHLLEVNINNLAAIPSIVFGLLGLAMFLGVMGLPRSTPLVGGMVLALMTLPTIIIAARASLKAVPPSIREGALGLGASPIQAAFHQVLPLAMPGMLTGSIIGMARALGDTAPLLMIGMVAFVVDVPTSTLDAATALPVQIFLWADSPERAFTERTAAAILVLLGFLVCMNLVAVILRKKLEIRW